MTSLAGQWIGETEDCSELVVLDLDENPPGTRGSGRIFFSDGSPGAICHFELPEFDQTHEFNSKIGWISPDRTSLLSATQISQIFPDLQFSEDARISLTRKGTKIELSWSTDLPTEGKLVLSRADMDGWSTLKAESLTWREFKDRALRYTSGSMIFRGQPARYKMRTSFHRTYRKDLVTYVLNDIPHVHRQLTARTNHLFDLSKGEEAGAFYNLLQHHGYPTPLLDWTYSPFVAAFFAYRRRKSSDEGGEKIRILAFDKELWVNNFKQIELINLMPPHFSIQEPLAIENPRAIPQQAVSTLTNIDDIEAYINSMEQRSGLNFLQAFDLEAADRPQVMAELSLMGITAGSLFPGLDGACEELMGRFFHHQVPPITSGITD